MLATNMISVGVDVDRLGSDGGHGSAAVDVPSTSRPRAGWAVNTPAWWSTIFNAARSRDRSHYETFIPLPPALYRAGGGDERYAVRRPSARSRTARGSRVARASSVLGVVVGLRRSACTVPPTRAGSIGQLIAQRAAAVSDEGGDTERDVDALVQTWIDAAEERPGLQYPQPPQLEGVVAIEAADALTDDADRSRPHGRPMANAAEPSRRRRGKHVVRNPVEEGALMAKKPRHDAASSSRPTASVASSPPRTPV